MADTDPLVTVSSARRLEMRLSPSTNIARFQAVTRRMLSLNSPARAMSSSKSQPLIELREYNVSPGHFVEYMHATVQNAELLRSLYPLRSFSLPDTGGQLLVPTHAYYYEGGHAERDQVRKDTKGNAEWKEYVDQTRPLLQSGHSNLFVEAPLVSQLKDQVSGLKEVSPFGQGSDCILELRRYHLKLGYDTVPKFLEYYSEGLPSKLSAPGTDPTTSLVTLLYSDVGRLNEVIEVWRHGNGTAAMEQSRQAARSAQEWRTAIASIAELALQFTSTIHRPTPFSPLK